MEAEIRGEDRIKQTSKQVDAARTADEALAALTEGLVGLLNAAAAEAFLLDAEAEHLHGQIAYPAEFQETIRKVRVSINDEASANAIAFRTRQPVVIDDAETDVRAKKWLMVFYRTKSFMSIPIMTGDRTFGTVAVLEHDSRHFTESETDLALLLARRAAEKLARLSQNP